MCLSLTLYIVILQGGKHKANLRATQSEADGPVSRRGGTQGGTKLPKIIPHKQVRSSFTFYAFMTYHYNRFIT